MTTDQIGSQQLVQMQPPTELTNQNQTPAVVHPPQQPISVDPTPLDQGHPTTHVIQSSVSVPAPMVTDADGNNIITASSDRNTVTLTGGPGGTKTIIIQNFENQTPEVQKEILNAILMQDSASGAVSVVGGQPLGPAAPAAVKAVIAPVKPEPITTTANVQVEAAPVMPPVTVQEFTQQSQD